MTFVMMNISGDATTRYEVEVEYIGELSYDNLKELKDYLEVYLKAD